MSEFMRCSCCNGLISEAGQYCNRCHSDALDEIGSLEKQLADAEERGATSMAEFLLQQDLDTNLGASEWVELWRGAEKRNKQKEKPE